MRLIDAGKLIEELNDIIKLTRLTIDDNLEDNDWVNWTLGELTGYRNIEKVIKKQPDWISPENSYPNWIPCDKRLPDEYGWYICSIKDGRTHCKYWDGKRWVDNIRKHMFDLYYIRSKLTGDEVTPEEEDVDWDGWVTAWMPLPDPYEVK